MHVYVLETVLLSDNAGSRHHPNGQMKNNTNKSGRNHRSLAAKKPTSRAFDLGAFFVFLNQERDTLVDPTFLQELRPTRAEKAAPQFVVFAHGDTPQTLTTCQTLSLPLAARAQR